MSKNVSNTLDCTVPTRGLPTGAGRPLPPAPVVGAAKEALDASEPTAAPVTTKAFWPLMDRWGVDDEMALRLLGHPGGLTSTGKRPRFTLTSDEVRRLGYLQEIGHSLETMFGDAGEWLRQRTSALPFNGLTPLEYIARRGSGGVAEVMRFLARFGLVSSLRS